MSMREPYLSEFTQAIVRGAAARDMHDSEGVGGYDDEALDAKASAAFVQRELDRVQTHSESLCKPLVARLGKAARILDAGCGTGGTTVALALSALSPTQVVGFDACDATLHAAKLRTRGYDLPEERVHYLHVPAGQRLPFDDGQFDLVTCVSVLEFIASPSARRDFLQSLLRTLKPGGHLYLATPNPWRLREYHSRRWLGDWRRQPGFPWASRAAELQASLPGCAVESLAGERLRQHPRWRRFASFAPLLAHPPLSWLPVWQRLLVRKPVQ